MITGVVLVAANMKTEDGELIPLKMVGSITVVERVVATFIQAGADQIVLVSGEQAPEIEKQVAHMGVVCLRDSDFEKHDMLSSAKIGFAYLKPICERVAFCPVDIPLFTADTVRNLFDSTEKVISPSYQGRGGHPLVMDQSVLPYILSFDKPGGIKEAIRQSGIAKAWLDVKDEGSMLDLAKNEISEDMVRAHKEQMLHPTLKIAMAKEQVFMGPGTMQLLELIENTGSVRNACQLMNISYSKGFKMIRLLEEQWGCPVVERKQGGLTGGSSYINEQGKDLMERYRLFSQEVKRMTEEIFHKNFGDFYNK